MYNSDAFRRGICTLEEKHSTFWRSCCDLQASSVFSSWISGRSVFCFSSIAILMTCSKEGSPFTPSHAGNQALPFLENNMLCCIVHIAT